MERESSKQCYFSFLWTNENFSLWNCLSRNSATISRFWFLTFAFGIEKFPGLSRNRHGWKAVLCFICLVCIQNQNINNFENDKMQKLTGLRARNGPVKFLGLSRNGWWWEGIEKKLRERLGTSLDLKPEVGKKGRNVPRTRFHDRMRELLTASKESLSRFLNL